MTQPILTSLKEIDGIYFKCEFENPTHSVKDRSISIQLEYVKKSGFSHAVISSSGNAGISAAYFGKNLNIKITVFVSPHVNIGKKDMLLKMGAEIIESKTPNKDAFKYSVAKNAYNLRQSKDPHALTGYRSLALELQSQISMCDAIFVPVSSGTMLEGIYLGYKNYPYIPAFHAVQTESVHPISSLYDKEFKKTDRSLADGIVARVTDRLTQIKTIIDSTKGFGWVISDLEMKRAYDYLSKHQIETSYEGCAAYAAYLKASKHGYTYNYPVVILSGRKY